MSHLQQHPVSQNQCNHVIKAIRQLTWILPYHVGPGYTIWLPKSMLRLGEQFGTHLDHMKCFHVVFFHVGSQRPNGTTCNLANKSWRTGLHKSPPQPRNSLARRKGVKLRVGPVFVSPAVSGLISRLWYYNILRLAEHDWPVQWPLSLSVSLFLSLSLPVCLSLSLFLLLLVCLSGCLSQVDGNCSLVACWHYREDLHDSCVWLTH